MQYYKLIFAVLFFCLIQPVSGKTYKMGEVIVNGKTYNAEDALQLYHPSHLNGVYEINGEVYVRLDDGAEDLENMDFQGRTIASFEIDTFVSVRNCNFRDANIQYIEGGEFENCDFTNTWIEYGDTHLTLEDLKITKNFKEKTICFHPNCAVERTDLSGFTFSRTSFYSFDVTNCNIQKAKFINCLIPILSSGQLTQTYNYRTGNFHNIQVSRDNLWSNIDLSNSFWGNDFHPNNSAERVILTLSNDVNLTNAVFVHCNLSNSRDLTLEQVKSTWNYKAGRMSLSQWPEHIQKALQTSYFNDFKYWIDNPDMSARKPVPLSIPVYATGTDRHFPYTLQDTNIYFSHADLYRLDSLGKLKNYQVGLFVKCNFLPFPPQHFSPPKPVFVDMQKMAFLSCNFEIEFSIKENDKIKEIFDLTEAVFVDCDLTNVQGLTLEQVKSTWNYKAGRMSLCKWPEYIEKALEEEEKAKAQEEKK
ncbi:MAG: pentapeptide repeat-containing protein [Thermoguttaceae bacterium]|nr:pentapeptide repeat-containing protein [Thermoguttaceae bacterium]